MTKYPIGFYKKPLEVPKPASDCAQPPETPCKHSVVQVYFPCRGASWAYYNDQFNLKVGDAVYVEGKLEGCLGQVTEVQYTFKIKLSDYKKVIAVVDTNVEGNFYIAGAHMLSFDESAIPYAKVRPWFKAPEEEPYISAQDDTYAFPLEDLTQMRIEAHIAERGHEYYMENRVSYIELDDTHGRAIVEGCEPYEIEFDYKDGEISNLTCTCFCSSACKHEFAAMLQLRETLKHIEENYSENYSGYFAALSKQVFIHTVMSKTRSGKISLSK